MELTQTLPFSQACENNKQPILEKLASIFKNTSHVLEIGSGTGQHAEYFAAELAHLHWQPSDVADNLADIKLRLESSASTALPPIELDINRARWPLGFDAAFSANTAHIMPWPLVEKMIAGVGNSLPAEGIFALYGPFNYEGKFSSESNARFEQWLKSHSQERGIRDFEKVNALASESGLALLEDSAMPANNRLLVWKKR